MSNLNNKFPWWGWVLALALFVTIVYGVSRLFAATTPTFGLSSSYAVLSSTYTDTSAATIIFGDVGFTTPPATPPSGVITNYGSGAPYASAGIDQGVVLGLLNAQPCDFNFVGATDLSLEVQPLQAGVYCVTGAVSVGTAGITLLSGTYIFRSTGALNTVANSVVSGGDACDVFWTPVATTLGANSTFRGTVIDDAGITIGAVTTWLGRALAFGGTVTTDSDTITAPSCVIPLPVPPTPSSPSLSNSRPADRKRCDTSTTPTCVEYFTPTSLPFEGVTPGLPRTGGPIED